MIAELAGPAAGAAGGKVQAAATGLVIETNELRKEFGPIVALTGLTMAVDRKSVV